MGGPRGSSRSANAAVVEALRSVSDAMEEVEEDATPQNFGEALDILARLEACRKVESRLHKELLTTCSSVQKELEQLVPRFKQEKKAFELHRMGISRPGTAQSPSPLKGRVLRSPTQGSSSTATCSPDSASTTSMSPSPRQRGPT